MAFSDEMEWVSVDDAPVSPGLDMFLMTTPLTPDGAKMLMHRALHDLNFVVVDLSGQKLDSGDHSD